MPDPRSSANRLFIATTVALVAWCSAGFAVPITAAAFQEQVGDISRNVRMVDGLRDRRLYRLARIFAAKRIADESLDFRERIDLVVADLQTLAAIAMTTQDAERDAAWQAFADGADSYIRQFQSSQRAILIQVQKGLTTIDRAERMRQEWEAELAPVQTVDQALAIIRVALRELDDIDGEITRLLADRSSEKEGDPRLSAEQLLALRFNLQYQRARALLNRAMLYPEEDKLNRMDALAQVEQQLLSVSQSVSPAQPVWWEAQRDRLAVARHERRFERAAQIASQLPDSFPSNQQRYAVQNELMLILLAQGRAVEAHQLNPLDETVTTIPELDLTRIKTLTELANQTGIDETESRRWQNRALELTKQVELDHGGYWSRRANMMVVDASAGQSVSSNVDMLIRIAAEAERKELWSDAIAALDTAADAAKREGEASTAFTLGYRAAVIHQQLGRHQEAARRMEAIADQYSGEEQAHSAHLMACWNFAKTVGDDSNRLQQYVAMLNHNVVTWPQSTSANQARLWLSNVDANRQKWSDSINTLLGIDPRSSLLPEVLRALNARLDAVRRLPAFTPSIEDSLNRLHEYAAALVLDENRAPLESLSPAQRHAAALYARSQIFAPKASSDPPLTLALLQRAFQQSSKDDPWQNQLRTQLVIANHRSDRKGELRSELLEACAADPSSAAEMVEWVTEYWQFSGVDQRKRAAELVVRAIEACHLQWENQNARTRKQWSTAYVTALQELEKNEEALGELQRLVRQHPNDRSLQVQLAEQLNKMAKSNASTYLADALLQWRRVARRSAKNSESWFAAKYHVARLLHQSGQTEEALKLLKYIQAFPPGWSNSPLADEFDELFKACGG